MALNLHVDTLDSIDESLKGFYKESEKGGFVLDVSGYQDPNPDGLKSAFEKQKEAAKQAKQEAQELKNALSDMKNKYKDIDPEKVKNLLSKIENDEEAKLLAEGKINDVLKMRMEKERADLMRQVQEANDYAKKEAGKSGKFEQRVLDNQIRAAAIEAGVHKTAIEDALLRARTKFTINDDGEAVHYESDGVTPVLGKDGKSPFTVKEWFDEMKGSASHWFPALNSGGGANGNSLTSQSKVDFSKLSPRERLLEARRKN